MTSERGAPAALLRWGDLAVDPRTREAWRNGSRLSLQHQPLQILEMLMERPGEVVTREELRGRLWPEGTFVDFDHSLNTAIKKLRRALGDSAVRPRYIETLPGAGYRLLTPPEQGADATPSRYPARPWIARASLLAALAVVLALLAHSRAPRPGSEDPPPIRITQLTALGNVVQANISPDGAYFSYGVNEAHATSSLWLRQIGAPSAIQLRAPSPREGWSAQFTPDGRFLYYALNDPAREERTLYRMPALGGESVEILSGIESKVSFSPDGARFAYIRDRYPTPLESSVLVANADGSGARIIATRRQPESFFVFFNAPAWSPDGTRIAVGCVRLIPGGTGGGSVIVMRPDGSQQRAIEPEGWIEAGQPEWLPDMSGLLVVAYDEFRIPMGSGQIWRLPFPEGPPARITNDLLGYRSLSLSADGSKLVTVAAHPKTSMWRIPLRTAEAPVRLTQVSNDGRFGVAPAPDGGVVFARFEEGQSNLYRTYSTGRTRRVALPEEMWAEQPAVSSDGRLAFLANRREIYTARLDGSDLRRLTHGAAPAFTPDGRSILFHRSSGGVPAIFSIPVNGGAETKLTAYSAQKPVVAPDGRHFAASCSYEGDIAQLCIIPIAGGPPSARVPYRIMYGTVMGWAAEGDALFVSGRPDGGDWANIYRVPLDGLPPARVTDLEGTGPSRFVVTEGGESLVVIRLDLSRDAMLITGFWAPADRRDH